MSRSKLFMTMSGGGCDGVGDICAKELEEEEDALSILFVSGCLSAC